MSSVAIITARGGSKRIPGKNLKEFCGRPIIEYSIAAAYDSEVFDEVMVSTDSADIADIAKAAGASVPFMRSQKTASDFAPTVSVIEEVLEEYAKLGRNFDSFCCMFPCAPFVTAEDLRISAEMLEGADAVVPVVAFSYPPQRALVVRNGKLSFLYPEYEFTRTQDLEPLYHDCAQFFFQKTQCFEKYGKLVPPGAIPYYKDDLHVQDIDNYTDWAMAEVKYKMICDDREAGK